jgi:hypothetical protein
MQIDVQLNFPAGTYNRRMAGAFVIEENGDFLVAHRGKLTKGKAGLPKAKVFREFASRTVEADDQGRTSKIILISALDDLELADRLWKFAVEARARIARVASAPPLGSASAATGQLREACHQEGWHQHRDLREERSRLHIQRSCVTH